MKRHNASFFIFFLFGIMLLLIAIPAIIRQRDQSALKIMDVNRARVLVSDIAIKLGEQFPNYDNDAIQSTEDWCRENEVSLYVLSLSGDALYRNQGAPDLPEQIGLMEFAQPDAAFYRQHPGMTRLMVPAMKNGVQVGNILFLIPLSKVSSQNIWWSPQNEILWLCIAVFLLMSGCALTWFLLKKHYEKPIQWMLQAIHATERDQALPDSLRENRMTPVLDGFDRLVDQWRDSFGKLVQAEQHRKEQLAVLSHEIRTPVTSIAMYAEGLESGLADTPEMKASYTAILAKKARELNRLVGDLFDHARQELDILRVEPVEVYAQPVLAEIVLSLKEAYTHSGRLHHWPSEIPNLLVPLDRIRLEQVLSNLIHNAVKNTEPGGKITLDIFLQDDRLVMTVTDDGRGIDPADLPHIFDRFYQGKSRPITSGSGKGDFIPHQDAGYDEKNRTNTTGAGLGLSICRSIVEAHVGRLYVESSLEKGTRITIVL